MSQTAYFDNAASAPVLHTAAEVFQAIQTDIPGNSQSLHWAGLKADLVVQKCVETFSSYFKVPSSHIVFTSGATESNNLAIWGAIGGLEQGIQWIKGGPQSQILTTAIEHSATSEVFSCFQKMGAQAHFLPVSKEGLLDLAELEKSLTAKRTKLLSVHHVQNEIGCIQDLKAISTLIAKHSPETILHVDAAQSFLKVPIALHELKVDLLSISAHKAGGPKGIGALILGDRFEKRAQPKLSGLLKGGSHQGGIRPGTLPVPLIAAFSSLIDFYKPTNALLDLRDYFIQKLPPFCHLNGPTLLQQRAPHIVNFSIPGYHSSFLMEAFSKKGIAVSPGSACTSSAKKTNSLQKMGVSEKLASSSIRASFNPSNTKNEIDYFFECLQEIETESSSFKRSFT